MGWFDFGTGNVRLSRACRRLPENFLFGWMPFMGYYPRPRFAGGQSNCSTSLQGGSFRIRFFYKIECKQIVIETTRKSNIVVHLEHSNDANVSWHILHILFKISVVRYVVVE